MPPPKIFALIAFRNEEQDLPGMFSHLRDYVDGFVALNDCSTDRSMKIAEAEPKMIRLLQRQISSLDHHFEVENRIAMLKAAREHEAQWVLCCDADERYETRFLEQLRTLLRNPPAQLMGLQLVSVWERLNQYRIGSRGKIVLFPSVDPEPYYPAGRLHLPWFPPRLAGWPRKILDYHLYHLGDLTRADRQSRHEKFSRVDSQRKHQPQGYDHLINESNIELAPVTPERAFRYE